MSAINKRLLIGFVLGGWLFSGSLFAQTWREMQRGGQATPADIQESAQSILDQDQFKHLKTFKNPFDLDGLLDDSELIEDSPSTSPASQRSRGSSSGWFDWLSGWDFGSLGSAIGLLVEVLFWGFLIAVGLVLIYFIGKTIARYERQSQELTEKLADQTDQQIVVAPGETAVNQYLARARELAARGEYAQAIMLLVQGAMSDIERRNQIKFRRGLTSYDYLRAVRSEPPRYQALRDILRIYEPIGFGRRLATADHFETSLHQFEAQFLAATPSSDG